MDESEEGATVVIPERRIVFESELFAAIVVAKDRHRGYTRTRYLVTLDLLETDPKVQRRALIETPEHIWRDLGVGERVQARLYRRPDGSWTMDMPMDTV